MDFDDFIHLSRLKLTWLAETNLHHVWIKSYNPASILDKRWKKAWPALGWMVSWEITLWWCATVRASRRGKRSLLCDDDVPGYASSPCAPDQSEATILTLPPNERPVSGSRDIPISGTLRMWERACDSCFKNVCGLAAVSSWSRELPFMNHAGELTRTRECVVIFKEK